jgi:hypothetical protein
MAKFDYKKWVTENKYGKLDEQAGSATVQIRNCNNSSATTLCLPNASNYSIGHQFKHQTAQGVKTGFLQSVTQQGCSAGQGAFYNNINIIEDPYVGACATNNITPDIPDTGGPTPTGSNGGSPLTGSDAITGSQTYGTQTCYYCYQGTVVQATGSSNPEAAMYIFDSDCNVVGENVMGDSTFGSYLGAQLYMTDSTTFGGTINPNQLTGTTPASWQWTTNPDACEETTSPTGSNSGGEPTGSFGTAGDYTAFDYPSGWEVTQWTVGFIDMVINHPNPCNFLQGRIDNFSGQLQGNIGPLQQNLLMQKLAVCQELFVLVGCGSLQEQSKKYKLDPKAASILKKMAPKLKGLASRSKGVKKESKKISTLKNIIRETILELQEIENVSGQSCYYTNSGGAEENQDPNYCAQAGQPCTAGSDTERCICDCTGGSNPGVLRKPSKDIKRAPKRVAISNPTRGIRGKRLKK